MLQQFQMALENLIGNPTDLRPFVCEGSPLDCRIFIVGFNPATELKRSFWDFWQPDYGFHLQLLSGRDSFEALFARIEK